MNSSRRRAAVPSLFVFGLVVSTIGVLLQAVTAGVFVNQDGRDSWVTVHGVIADVTWVSALLAAVAGFRRVRGTHRRLWQGTAALFVLTLVQTGLGHLITERGIDALIVVHVPLAVLIFGLAALLLTALVPARRTGAAGATGLDPYVDETAQPLPIANRR